MTSTSDPIFSPDGEHIWTGTEWIPAHPDSLATRKGTTQGDRTSGTLESLSDGPGVMETVKRETEGDVLDVLVAPEVWSAIPRRPVYGFIFRAAGAIRRGSLESRTYKIKFLLQPKESPLLYMAGLYSSFEEKYGNRYPAYVILTVNANASVLPIHDRIPLIVEPGKNNQWLHDEKYARSIMLAPCLAELSAIRR